MNKKLVVMIGPSLESKGGIASVVSGYIRAGLFEAVPVRYLTTHVETGKLGKLRVALSSLLDFSGLMICGRVQLVHIHVARWNSFWRKSIFVFMALLFRRKVIIHLHSGKFSDFYIHDCNVFQKAIVRYVLRKSACVIVLTRDARAWVADIVGPDNVRLLPNFIDSKSRPADIVETKIHGQVLFLGRFTQEKGVFDLLDALPAIAARHPYVRLILCGDGDMDLIREKIRSLNLDEYVTLPGWVSGYEKQHLLEKSNIFVLPSYEEGLPICILEAMQMACPVVATRVGGIPDQVIDGVQGVLLEPGDVTNLAAAICRLLDDESLCVQMGKAGQETIKTQFSDTVLLPRLLALYKSLGM